MLSRVPTLLLAAAVGGTLTLGLLATTGSLGPKSSLSSLESSASSLSRPAGLSIREVHDRAAPGVVHVRSRTLRAVASPYDLGPRRTQEELSGSGWVLDDDGRVVTNAHLVAHSTQVTVILSPRTALPARVIGKDPYTDLALLAVEPDGLELAPLELGESGALRAGDPVVGIANPAGDERTVAVGVIAALRQRVAAPGGFAVEDVMQIDAPLEPGATGGPVLDGSGRVVGVRSRLASGQDGLARAFVVPADTVRAVLAELEERGRVRRAYLGLQIAEADGPGVRVVSVDAAGPGAGAGVRPGDVVRRVGEQDVVALPDLGRALARHQVGETVAVALLRDGRPLRVRARLAERPSAMPTREEPYPVGP